jgi:hypothetical protein
MRFLVAAMEMSKESKQSEVGILAKTALVLVWMAGTKEEEGMVFSLFATMIVFSLRL